MDQRSNVLELSVVSGHSFTKEFRLEAEQDNDSTVMRDHRLTSGA